MDKWHIVGGFCPLMSTDTNTVKCRNDCMLHVNPGDEEGCFCAIAVLGTVGIKDLRHLREMYKFK